MTSELIAKPNHGDPIGTTQDGLLVYATEPFQKYLDGIEEKLNQFLLGQYIKPQDYAKADLPSPVPGSGLIHVTDDIGGPVLAYADGTNWRRVSDGAVIA